MSYRLTAHASRRAAEMKLDEAAIRDVLFRARTARTVRSPKHPDGRYLYRRGDLGAIVAVDRRGVIVVITFLPATEEGWRRWYPEASGDREFRPDDW